MRNNYAKIKLQLIEKTEDSSLFKERFLIFRNIGVIRIEGSRAEAPKKTIDKQKKTPQKKRKNIQENVNEQLTNPNYTKLQENGIDIRDTETLTKLTEQDAEKLIEIKNEIEEAFKNGKNAIDIRTELLKTIAKTPTDINTNEVTLYFNTTSDIQNPFEIKDLLETPVSENEDIKTLYKILNPDASIPEFQQATKEKQKKIIKELKKKGIKVPETTHELTTEEANYLHKLKTNLVKIFTSEDVTDLKLIKVAIKTSEELNTTNKNNPTYSQEDFRRNTLLGTTFTYKNGKNGEEERNITYHNLLEHDDAIKTLYRFFKGKELPKITEQPETPPTSTREVSTKINRNLTKKPENYEKLKPHQKEGLKLIKEKAEKIIEESDNAIDAMQKLQNAKNFYQQLTQEIKGTTWIDGNLAIVDFKEVKNVNLNDLFDPNENLNLKTILKIKEKQLTPKEYENYLKKGRIRRKEVSTDKIQKKEVIQNYKELTKDHRYTIGGIRKSFEFDKGYTKERKFNQTEFKRNWENLQGSKAVEETMKKPPFSLNREQTANAVWDILANGRTAGVFDFDDIMDVFGETEKLDINYKIVPKEFLESNTAFTDELQRLETKGNNRTKNEEKRYHYMEDKILVPTIQLLTQIQSLKLDKKQYVSREALKKRKEEENRKFEKLDEREKQALKNIEKLAGFTDRKGNGWEDFIGWIKGSKVDAEKLYVSDMDGKTSAIDRGLLQQHYSKNAVIKTLIYSKGLYEIEDGKYKINNETLTKEINKLMKIGFANKFMKEQTKTGSTTNIKTVLQSEEFKNRLAMYHIDDISTAQMTDEQTKAFQSGFIINQETKFDKEIKKGRESFKALHPALANVVTDLEKQGIPKETIIKVEEAVIGGVGIEIKDGKFNALGIETMIDVGNDFKLSIGGGIKENGNASIGLGLSLNLIKNDKIKASTGVGVSLEGIGAGVSTTIKGEYINTVISAGAFWSGTTPTIGGGISFKWNIQNQFERETKAIKDKSQLKQTWENFKNHSKSDIEGKYKEIQKIPALKTKLNALQKTFQLEDSDIVHIVEQNQNQIDDKVLEDLHYPIPFISSIGVVMMGPVPIPTIGIVLGSVKVFIPNRREIAKLKEKYSDSRIQQTLNSAIDQIDDNPNILQSASFEEKMPQVTYSPDGSIMILKSKQKVDLSKKLLGQFTFDINKVNETLKKANVDIQLKQIGEGKTAKYELILPKGIPKYGKDEEIYIDETLGDIGIIKDGNRLFLSGDITNLVITRQRYFLPRKGSESMSETRDVITIRKRGSKGSDWMQQHNARFLRRAEGTNAFTTRRGAGKQGLEDTRIINAPGYGRGNYDALTPENYKIPTITESEIRELAIKSIKQKYPKIDKYRLKQKLQWEIPKIRDKFRKNQATIAKMLDAKMRISDLKKRQSNIRELLTPTEAQGYEADYKEMLSTLNTGTEKTPKSIDTQELYNNLNKLWENNKFRGKFRRSLDNTTKLIGIIKKYSKNVDGLKNITKKGNEQKINQAILYLTFKHFTTLYPKGKFEGLKPKEKQRVNKKVIRQLKRRENFARRRVYIPLFTQKLQSLDSSLSLKQAKKQAKELAKELADKMLGDIYNPIYEKLKSTEPFTDFRKLQIDLIPDDSHLVSATRNLTYKKDPKTKKWKLNEQGVATENIHYQNIKNATLKGRAGIGFIEGSTKEYSPSEGSAEDKLLASILLESNRESIKETTSTKDLLKNKTTKKLLSLQGARFLFKKAEYKEIANTRKTMNKGTEVQMTNTLKKLKSIVEKIQKAQVSGETVEFNCPEKTGFKFIYTPNTKIVTGAFSKCANASFYTKLGGTFSLVGKADASIIAAYDESREIVDVRLAKKFFNLNLGVKVTESVGQPRNKQNGTGKGNKTMPLKKTAKPGGETTTPNGTVVRPKGSTPPTPKSNYDT